MNRLDLTHTVGLQWCGSNR